MSLQDGLVDGASPMELSGEGIAREPIAVPCPVCDCNSTVDVVLQAADGTKYGAHTLNLQLFSAAFPTSDSVVVNLEDSVILSEAPEVLRLMLGFMHHGPLPDLDRELFETVAKLADAAEKYIIHSAMTVCRLQMELKAQSMPLHTLNYAWTNNYMGMADRIAHLTLSYTAGDAEKHLHSPILRAAWYKYRTQLEDIFSTINTVYLPPPMFHKGGGLKCRFWKAFHPVVRQALQGMSRSPRPTAFSEAAEVVSMNAYMLDECKYCMERAERWKKNIRQITIPGNFSEMF